MNKKNALNKKSIYKKIEPYLLPEFEFILDNSLAFTIKVCEWLLPEVHETKKSNKSSILNLTVSNLLNR